MSRNPEHLEQSTREHVHLLCSQFRKIVNGRYHLDVICTYRDAAAQAKALTSGASAKGPGGSKHNIQTPTLEPRSFACDLAVADSVSGVLLEGKTRSDFLVYEIAGSIWESFGGVWGGRWKKPCDPGHFEAPGKINDLWAGIPPRWTS